MNRLMFFLSAWLAVAENAYSLGPAGAAPATPMSLRFFGYASSPGRSPQSAFFLVGKIVFVAAQGELIQERYKVVVVAADAVVVEDTSDGHVETLPLSAGEVEKDAAPPQRTPGTAPPRSVTGEDVPPGVPFVPVQTAPPVVRNQIRRRR